MAAVPPQEIEMGQRIRESRQAKGLSLRAVAGVAGISQSFLSQVERGVASPSVSTLIRIADAVERPVASLLAGSDPSERIVRADDRRQLSHPRRWWVDEFLTPAAARRLQVNLTTIEPGFPGEPAHTHASDEELVIVLEGVMTIDVAGEHFELGEGDALLLDPTLPHNFANPGTIPARVLWIMTPPSYGAPAHRI
jgi:transcriptional regulator with XRE-family HTH domain